MTMNKDMVGSRKKLFLTSVFLVTFSMLSFEVALTRLLSVYLSHHYVFVVISIAVMGQGVGAMWQASKGRKVRCISVFFTLENLAIHASWCGVFLGGTCVLLVLLSCFSSLPFLYLVLIFPPFFWGGLFLAKAFQYFPYQCSSVYAADLFGAASGCLGVVALLQLLKPVQVVSLVSVCCLFSSLLLFRAANDTQVRCGKLYVTSHLVFVFSCFFAVSSFHKISTTPFQINQDKEIYSSLQRGVIEKTYWSAFGQTDLVTYSDFLQRKDIYIDGTAGAPMYQFTGVVGKGEAWEELKNRLEDFPGSFLLQNLLQHQKDSCLIIGPGGGRDILLSLIAGFRTIEAVEVNPDFVQMVNEYSSYNGNIFNRDNVEITVDEGRGYLRRQNTLYDLIFMSLPVTNTSRNQEGATLTENFLITEEAIQEYYDHLTPEGQLVLVTHGDVEVMRLLVVFLSFFDNVNINVTDAMKHISLIGHDEYPVLSLSKSELSSQRISKIVEVIKMRNWIPQSSFFPNEELSKYLNNILCSLYKKEITLVQMINKVNAMGYDITSVNDNKPYFYDIKLGLPTTVSWVLGISCALLCLVFVSILKMLMEYCGTHINHVHRILLRKNIFLFSLLFTTLGVGFMVIEVFLTQQVFLFLGTPTLSLAIVLSSVLIGAAIGGRLSGFVKISHLQLSIKISLLVIVSVLLTITLVLPILVDHFFSYSLFFRMLILVPFLVFLGLVLGFPFPLGLRLVRHSSGNRWVPWMLGVNSISSVLGSALYISISMTYGSIEAIVFITGCYISCLLIFYTVGVATDVNTREGKKKNDARI